MTSKYIQSLFSEDTAYLPRKETDAFFGMPQGSCKYSGVFNNAVRYIEEEQLLDDKLWKLFVNQYRFEPDDRDNGWRCEYWGKMMRGACFTYMYTQNAKLYETLQATVYDMLCAQDDMGRFSTYSLENEFNGWDVWGRKYILLGFQYFLDICKHSNLSERIIDTICRHADYIIEKLGPKEEGKIPITLTSDYWKGLNSSSILEPFVRLYNITGMKKYLDFAEYIINAGAIEGANLFELAYEGKLYPYEYPVTKAYEMMSCIEGLLEYYRVTKIQKWLTAAENFTRLVMESDITVIGCSGCTHELFDNSSEMQTNEAYNRKIHMQETCVTVTWMKLCYQMLCLTGDCIYADEIEKSAYNALLGAVNTERSNNSMLRAHGAEPDALKILLPFDSYSPLLSNIRGKAVGGLKFMENGAYYGCCACIASAGTGLIPMASAMLGKDEIVFNIYSQGVIETQTPGMQKLILEIDTLYPFDGAVKITVHCKAPERFTLAMRVPFWCKEASITTDGATAPVKPGYAQIDKEWHGGETVILNMSMPVFTHRQDGYIALQRGPVVLARDARFGGDIDEAIDIVINGDGTVNAVINSSKPFEGMLFCSISQVNGDGFMMTDYASAGKTWDESSRMAAWLPLKE